MLEVRVGVGVEVEVVFAVCSFWPSDESSSSQSSKACSRSCVMKSELLSSR